MTIQNIYDDPQFFEGYKNLRKNGLGFNAVLEQPALRSLLGDLSGKVILDIGCGFGEFCRYARIQGAKHVVGLDPSENMIRDAQAETNDNGIEYVCAPIETYQTNPNAFDVITSSLAFHYVVNFDAVIQKIKTWLKPTGLLVFSVEHPICTAQALPATGADFHAIQNYRDEAIFRQKWFVEGVEKYHRPVSSYLNTLLNHGLIINQVLEPMPTDEQIKANPNFAIHKIRPPLLMISAINP